MTSICWMCGGKLCDTSLFVEAGSDILRVHKVCYADAFRFWNPPNIGSPPRKDGPRYAAINPDDL